MLVHGEVHVSLRANILAHDTQSIKITHTVKNICDLLSLIGYAFPNIRINSVAYPGQRQVQLNLSQELKGMSNILSTFSLLQKLGDIPKIGSDYFHFSVSFSLCIIHRSPVLLMVMHTS